MPTVKESTLFKSAEELIESEKVLIKGHLPEYVRGSFLRNGPGQFDLGKDFVMNSFLDGYSIISKFQISGDSVSFSKKYLQTDAYKGAMTVKKPIYFEFGTRSYPDPSKSFFSRYMPSIVPELSDNCNISLFNMGENLLAFGEGCYFSQINSKHLDCGRKFDSKSIFSQNVISPHPLTDSDGTVWNIGSSMTNGLKFNIIKTPKPLKNESPGDTFKKSKIICSINSRHMTWMSYSHSFGLTEKYIIFIEQPLVLNVTKILGSALNKGNTCLSSWLEWHPSHKNRFHIIEKATGKHSEVEIVSENPFFFLHFVNAYEVDSSQIIIDIMTFPDASVFNSMNLDLLRKGQSNADTPQVSPTGQRFSIPILFSNKELQKIPEGYEARVPNSVNGKMCKKQGKIIITPENITERGAELPCINRKFQGKKNDYYYIAGAPMTTGPYANSIGKVCTKSKKVTLWTESKYHVMGEPIFIPDPNNPDQEEDKGVILFAVSDESDSKDQIIFLNAQNMKCVAKAEFNSHIPLALHGIFIPSLSDPDQARSG